MRLIVKPKIEFETKQKLSETNRFSWLYTGDSATF
ncbi:unnamed protein product [Paramecium octaurelia]|uniref:Uncharacterized protein n=1 Tax=Paramecium octaurelia TaxID=43137 RepID=A0A8S1VXR8_PAROT|nr:unnamed protein product [Paramecium octaurelia]